MAVKLNRNDPCHCGSGKKYKNCCQKKDQSNISSKLGMIGVIAAVLLGLLIVGLALSGDDRPRECPPGTSWSSSHQHCH